MIEHLERRVGGVRAGSASFVWRLGPVGDSLLRQAALDRPRARRKEPSLRHLDHCLAVAETHLTLLDLARHGDLELLQVDTEPDCWRHYLGTSGSRETLKPDLYSVTANGEYEDHWFCEIDRGTESLPTVLSKCAQYETYRRYGDEQQRLSVYPAVVWIMLNSQHAERLTTAIARSRNLTTDLYRVCTPNQFASVIRRGAA